jgi:two-component system OmpR family response regulator
LRGLIVQSASVLLVDDEPLLADIIEANLTEAGFDVVTVLESQAALDFLESHLDTVSALVTDIDLGAGASGWVIARRARELSQTLPVVYVSGGSAHQWSSEGVPNSIMIAKPFVGAQIVVAVSSLLNAIITPPTSTDKATE